MFLWFVAFAVVVVALVFQSSGVDYRMVAAGGAVPLAENLLPSGPWVLHSVIGGVGLLTLVMAVTAKRGGRGRRLVRRRWLGLPIGVLTFLVASASFTRSELFWWPVAGDPAAAGGPPELERPLGLLVLLELLGMAMLVWLWRRHGLTDRVRRNELLKSGRLRPQPPPAT